MVFLGALLTCEVLKKTVNQAKKAVDTWLTLGLSVIATFKNNQ
ncbi:MAG: hypothetical protein AAGM46_06605 [Cyanobacteria bacterium J06582_2]